MAEAGDTAVGGEFDGDERAPERETQEVEEDKGEPKSPGGPGVQEEDRDKGEPKSSGPANLEEDKDEDKDKDKDIDEDKDKDIGEDKDKDKDKDKDQDQGEDINIDLDLDQDLDQDQGKDKDNGESKSSGPANQEDKEKDEDDDEDEDEDDDGDDDEDDKDEDKDNGESKSPDPADQEEDEYKEDEEKRKRKRKRKSKSKAPPVRRKSLRRRQKEEKLKFQVENNPYYLAVVEQYAVLVNYCQQLMKLNPGTTAIIKSRTVDGQRIFERVYMCMEACKSGFKACRPIIALKGCNLNGYCKGVLLTAIGIDADNTMFPIAVAVCEKESTETWDWFLNLLKEDLEVVDTTKFTVISNGREELENVLASVFEGAEIRICVRHLHANFRKEFPGLLMKQLLWACAKATSPGLFKRKMEELKGVNEKAYEWLMKQNPSKWSRSHFPLSTKYDSLLNVLCEGFISAISEVRDKPIITLLEYIRYWLMCRFNEKRESLVEWLPPVGKRILKMIEKNEELARQCTTTRAATYIFQVNHGPKVVAVNLAEKNCSCKKFDLSGIPCEHALAAILSSNFNLMDYVDDVYKKERLIDQWAKSIQPMPSPDKWTNLGKNPIYPPPVEAVSPEKPEKKRKRDCNELIDPTTKYRRDQPNHCSNCGQQGHSKVTCKNPKVVKPVTIKRMGRPPKMNLDPETIKRNERRLRQKAREAALAQAARIQGPHPIAQLTISQRPQATGSTAGTVSQADPANKLARAGQPNRCGNCGQQGHSRVTCQNPAAAQTGPKKRLGRPPKASVDPDAMSKNERRLSQKAREAALAQAAQNPGPSYPVAQAVQNQGPSYPGAQAVRNTGPLFPGLPASSSQGPQTISFRGWQS